MPEEPDKTGPLSSLVDALTQIDLFYWRGRDRSALAITPLLLGGALFLSLCRGIFFGFDQTLVTLLCQIMGFFFLAVSCSAACIRPGAELPIEISKLAHLLAACWLLAQSILVISVFPSLRWFDSLPFTSTWPLAFIYAAAATLVLFIRSFYLRRRRPALGYLCTVPLLVCALTTVFLNTTIMDVDTNAFLQDQAEALKTLFNQ